MSNLKIKLSFLYHCSSRLPMNIYIHDKVKNLKLRKLFDILLIPFGLVQYCVCSIRKKQLDDYKFDLSIVTIIKNEATYIDEWIRYYISIGVDHFYIYDNDSNDNIESILSKYGSKVTYRKMSGKLRQLDAYNDALNRFGRYTKYFAVIDADEFIYCTEKNHKLYPIVDEYLSKPKIGGLAVNWVIFGSSHYKNRPKGLVTDNYVYRSKIDFEKNKHIKTICNPRKVFNFSITHHPNYLPGFYAVNEDFQRTDGSISDRVCVERIRINHYYSKSESEFLQKRKRGAGDVMNLRNLSEFAEHDKNDIYDDSLLVYNCIHKLD